MKLHIGGKEAHPDWQILNVQEGPHVDFLGNCTDLSQFENDSVEAVYASHVFEHLDYTSQLKKTITDSLRKSQVHQTILYKFELNLDLIG